MYRTPFHRRIIPWLYTIVFFALAPILIYYTAGYRYNAKKGLVERNGTIIVDSTPSGARVELDGRDTGETTPITLQNIVPGSHAIRVYKPSYSTWKKRLDVRPEQVTFANDIRLWLTGHPELVLAAPVESVAENPSRDQLALVLKQGRNMAVLPWSPDQPSNHASAIPESTSNTRLLLQWQPQGQALELLDADQPARAWWMRLTERMSVAESVRPGFTRWSNGDLVSVQNRTIERIRVRDGSVLREPLSQNVLDQENDFQLSMATSSDKRSLVKASLLSRQWELPSGAWNLASVDRSSVLLRDRDRWIAVSTREKNPYAGSASGDYPRWLPRAETPTALLINRNELWLWNIGKEPTLVWRQSDPIVQALWHRSGKTVFVAAREQVFALDLDERDGRTVTRLANFSTVTGMGMIDRDLYVAGTSDAQKGLWRLPLE